MNRTITALFENRADAEEARTRLTSCGVAADHIDIQAYDTSDGRMERDGSGGHGKGFFGALKDLFLPHDDHATYEEGLRRGHALLTVNAEDQQADMIVRELDKLDAVDVDERSREWTSDGWERPVTTDMSASIASDAPMTSDVTGEDRIPIVEEQLVVGKREVARGGARVRSYVVETPVTERVRLREEHVSVERRAVDEPVTNPDALFQERNIEVTETAEEAVVGKQARVREELVVRKEAGEREETVTDTVRHTEVEVDDKLTRNRNRNPERAK